MKSEFGLCLGQIVTLLFYTQDDFRIYSRKAVTWISVSAFIKSRSDNPATEEDSIFSKAIMKPSLQVSIPCSIREMMANLSHASWSESEL